MNKTQTRNTKLLIITLCLLLLPLSVDAKDDELKIEHTIDSKFPAEKRIVTVKLPESYLEETNSRYPVLYLLDGQSNLDFSDSIVDFLAGNASMPDVIIVAMHSNENRSRDYLPPNSEKRFSGNASQYLQHIEKELIPFVNKNYRTANFKILSGHSYGGVFVTHAMLEKPDLFQAYIAQSPYYSKEIGDPLVKRMTKFLSSNPKLDKFYYMNVGNEPRLKQNFDKVVKLFETNAPKTFRWNAKTDEKKSHMTTRLIGQYEALEALFSDDWTLSPQKIAAGKFEGFKMYIDSLSKKYGYTVILSERTMVQATQTFLSQRDQPSAIKTAELYTSHYPISPIGHFFLAVAYGRQNKEKASKSIETAIKLYEANPKPGLKRIYSNMKQVQKQLASH